MTRSLLIHILLILVLLSSSSQDSLAQPPGTINTPLPIRLLSFTGNADQFGSTLLEWTVNETPGTQQYTIERSDDGMSFRRIGRVAPRGGTGTHAYTFIDPETLQGVAYYHIEMAEAGGSTSYSPVISVKYNRTFTFPYAKPSPFSCDLTVTFQTATSTVAHLKLVDATGKVCTNESYQLNTGVHNLKLPNLHTLAPGIYFLELRQDDHRLLMQRVEKQ